MMAHGKCEKCYKKQYRIGYYAAHKEQWVRCYGENLRQWRIKVLEKLGNKCRRCGFSDPRALQIDHVFGGGNKELSEFGRSRQAYYKKVIADVEGRYQLLCANCNWIKRYENREYGNEFDAQVTEPGDAGLAEAGSQVEEAV